MNSSRHIAGSVCLNDALMRRGSVCGPAQVVVIIGICVYYSSHTFHVSVVQRFGQPCAVFNML